MVVEQLPLGQTVQREVGEGKGDRLPWPLLSTSMGEEPNKTPRVTKS